MGGLLKIKRRSFLRGGSGRSSSGRSSSTGGAMYVPGRHTELLTVVGSKKMDAGGQKSDIKTKPDVAESVPSTPDGTGTSGQNLDNATQPEAVPSAQSSREEGGDRSPEAPVESNIKTQVRMPEDDLDDLKGQLEDEIQKQKERLIPELSLEKHNKDAGLSAGKIGAVCLLIIPVFLLVLHFFFDMKPQQA